MALPLDEVRRTARRAGFQEIYLNDQSYCQWVLMTRESGDSCSDGLKRFASYIVAKEQQEAYLDVPVRDSQDSDLEMI